MRAPGSKEEEEGEIAGRWFIILLDFTNTLYFTNTSKRDISV